MIWLLIAITILGLILLTHGVRGRVVGAEPRCRACKFDLTGLNLDWLFGGDPFGETPGTLTCPECGASLSPRDAIRTGLRRRRRGLVFAGAVLLLPIVGGVAASFNWIAWNPSKPLSILKMDIYLGTDPIEDAATQEILDRLVSGKLTVAERLALSGLAADRVGQGAAGSLEWLELYLEAKANDRLTESQIAQAEAQLMMFGESLAEPMVVGPTLILINIDGEMLQFTYPHLDPYDHDDTLSSWTPFKDEVYRRDSVLPVSLIYNLDRITVGDQQISLRDGTSNWIHHNGTHPGETQVGVYGLGGGNSGTYVGGGWMDEGPSSKRPVPRKSTYDGPTFESEGLRLDQLPPGDHQCTAFWTGYLGVELDLTGGFSNRRGEGTSPWNSPGAPTFGPFEIKRDFVYRVYSKEMELYSPLVGAAEQEAIRRVVEAVEFQSLTFTSKRDDEQPAGELAFEIKGQVEKLGLIGRFYLESDGERFPISARPSAMYTPERFIKGLPAITLHQLIKGEDRHILVLDQSDSDPATVQVSAPGLKGETVTVVFVPSLEDEASFWSMPRREWLALFALFHHGPVPVLDTEVRWENVPITFIEPEED